MIEKHFLEVEKMYVAKLNCVKRLHLSLSNIDSNLTTD